MKAIVFDFDGTLLDTETLAFEVVRTIFEEHGQELALARWALGIGTVGGPYDPYADLEQLIGRPLDHKLMRARYEADLTEKADQAELRAGVKEWLEEARRLGLSIGLASSSTREWIERHLRSKGIREYFETIRTSDDVERVKPDPALYRLAVADLGVKPAEAVAVEDSLHGLTAAKKAGMHAIAVPNAVTRQMDFLGADADLLIDSLADQPLEQLLEKLALKSID
ncbi:HAD family hydrolase [Cohnella pontilimi]|uniref:HAD family hydrolase n=1 Tax=Cohnella pontilimi TaxID=2564100 RepID=A0A4U0FDE6_9BACL|nr:HAD family hydrolase [Cohnella pontilimi]